MSQVLRDRHFRFPSPVSWGAYLGLTLLTGVLVFLSGCAFTPPPPNQKPIPLKGFYNYSGSASGTHRYRYRSLPFTVTVSGWVEFSPDQVRVSGTHGTCTVPMAEVNVMDETRIAVECGSGRFEFGQEWGRTWITVREERERVGDCEEYQVREDGSRGPCIRWRWITYFQPRRVSVALALSEPGE